MDDENQLRWKIFEYDIRQRISEQLPLTFALGSAALFQNVYDSTPPALLEQIPIKEHHVQIVEGVSFLAYAVLRDVERQGGEDLIDSYIQRRT